MSIKLKLIVTALVAGILQSPASAKPPETAARTGHGIHWGLPPSGNAFTAGLNYTALVYMQLRTSANNELVWKVEHSIFRTQNIVDPAALDRKIKKIVERQARRSNNCDWNHDEDEATCGLKADARRPNRRAYRDLKDNLFVNQKVRYYIVIDNEGIRFDDKWPLMFTRFSAGARAFPNLTDWEDPAKGVERKMNDAYFNARVGGASGVLPENVVYFENLSQNPSPVVPAKYSMNLNLWMSVAGSSHEIPIIIDPDTGNGSGSPPPANP